MDFKFGKKLIVSANKDRTIEGNASLPIARKKN